MATEMKAVATTLDVNGVPTSVFREMANFRSRIDKDKLREMERPEGLWVCARLIRLPVHRCY